MAEGIIGVLNTEGRGRKMKTLERSGCPFDIDEELSIQKNMIGMGPPSRQRPLPASKIPEKNSGHR